MIVQWYFLSAQSQIQEWRAHSKAEAGDYWTLTAYIPCGRYVCVLDTGLLRSRLLLWKTLSLEIIYSTSSLLFFSPLLPPFPSPLLLLLLLSLLLLSLLSTGEALHLSSDFRRLCDNCFPHSELAQIIARQHTGTPEAQPRISMVKAAQ